MKFSFIHTGDIHLGRPFSDLSEINDKTDICNNACKLAFDNITETAISKKADFVLIAGDSFDSDEQDLSAKLSFIRNLEKLAQNGISTYVICGNHDPIEIYKNFRSYFKDKYDGLINIVGITTEDNTYTFRKEGYNLHAVSFKTDEMDSPINYLPKLSKEDEKSFNIALLHCDLDKTESKYSPVSREELRLLNYDYYALGHIHIPEIKENKIVYAGTPQARTKKETGAHGCYYIEVEDKNIINTEFIPVDVVRFEDIEIDCSDYENCPEIFEEITNKINDLSASKLTLYEVTLRGVSKACNELLKSDDLTKDFRENFAQNESQNAFVYKINNETKPFVNEEELLNDSGVIGIITKTISNGGNEFDDLYEKISDLHKGFYKKLGLDTSSKELLSEALDTDKEKITDKAKEELKSLCGEIYGEI